MRAQPFIGSIVEERYRVEEQLGAGAMGSVYRGRHIKVGRTVAIKVLHDHLVREPEMVDRFEREAHIAAKLKHPNLVSVIDLGTTADGQLAMILEFAPGQPLAELVSAPLARDRAIALTRQLLAGLEHAHARGLVHRDLKPENVLVERTGDGREIARIVDFGIAVLRDADDSIEGRRLTTSGMVVGTPMYMSPEQARGEHVDERTDLFALGVIVYEMLAGTPPFDGTALEIMMANLSQDPPSVHARTGRDVDPLLEAFARKLMAREASERFPSAREALAVLDMIDRDRDAAARAMGMDSVPERVEEKAVTVRHPRVEMAPLRVEAPVRDEAVRGEEVRGEASPRRANWGVVLGAAALVVAVIALIVAIA